MLAHGRDRCPGGQSGDAEIAILREAECVAGCEGDGSGTEQFQDLATADGIGHGTPGLARNQRGLYLDTVYSAWVDRSRTLPFGQCRRGWRKQADLELAASLVWSSGRIADDQLGTDQDLAALQAWSFG